MNDQLAESFDQWVNEGMAIYLKALEENEDPMIKASKVYLQAILDNANEEDKFKHSCKILSDTLATLSKE